MTAGQDLHGAEAPRTLKPLVVLVVLLSGVARLRRERRHRRRIAQTEDLRYRVPEGQDPAAIVGRLRVSDFWATIALVDGEEFVVIRCDPVADRERVRDLVRTSPINTSGDPSGRVQVRFVDEQEHLPQ